MYDLSYLKKRRRKKIAALVSLFTAIGITSLVIISFLGRTVGTFSVKLKNSDVNLALSEKLSFDYPTTYLYVKDVGKLRETSFSNLPDLDYLDNEETPTKNDKALLGDGSYSFIKYTFYIQNTGNTTAKYNLSINITDSQESQDGNHRLLDDTLRIMVFENDPYDLEAEDHHKYRVYANDTDKWNYFIDENGEKITNVFYCDPYSSFQKGECERNHEFVRYIISKGKTFSSISVPGHIPPTAKFNNK